MKRSSRQLAALVKQWQNGKRLTMGQAVKLNCYICLGGELEDCMADRVCPLYHHGIFARKGRKGANSEGG